MEILVVVISWLLFGGATSYFASQRGRDPFAWFLIGMLLGILGLLLLFLLPPLEVADETKEIDLDLEETASSPAPDPTYAYRIKDWFFLDEKRHQEGPCTFTKLKKGWNEGKLTERTLVWSEGMENWKAIAEIPELKDALQ